ncbi:hypothetical protein GCM10010222_14650 [Streptomyces tanashiensis]|nr:hypothetical protein GCM10010222_14650 [Streptomyces tanashiensis]
MFQAPFDEARGCGEGTLLGTHVRQVQAEGPVGRVQEQGGFEGGSGLIQVAPHTPGGRSCDGRPHDPIDGIGAVAQREGQRAAPASRRWD